MPLTSDPAWPNVTVAPKKGLLGMNPYVMDTPSIMDTYSIG